MIFKIDIGEKTEGEVEAFVENAFSPHFVFRSPRKDDLDEATDVLVLWDDVGLVIQVKAQALSPIGQSQDQTLKWARKNIAKAGRQVAGAVRALCDGRVTQLENRFRGRLPFPREEVKWIYGVIVVHHLSAPYDPFEEVPELRTTKVPLHVFSFRDFWNLAGYLDTPADLVNYLEHRSDVLIPTLKPRVHEEESVFRYCIENLESLMAFRAEKRGEAFTADNARPYATALRSYLTGNLPESNLGDIIDDMIERAREHDPNLGPLRRGQVEIESQPGAPVAIATLLSRISRVRRIALGRRYWKAIWRAARENDDARVMTFSARRSECILFLASPLPLGEREVRRQRLLAMTEMYKHYRHAERAIGIATEAGEDAGRSYDFLCIEYEPAENEEAFLAAKEIFGGQESTLFNDIPE